MGRHVLDRKLEERCVVAKEYHAELLLLLGGEGPVLGAGAV